MSWGLVAAFVWLIVANVVAMFPSRDQHWTWAYVLIAVGIPILGWVTWESGPIWGMVLLAAGVSAVEGGFEGEGNGNAVGAVERIGFGAGDHHWQLDAQCRRLCEQYSKRYCFIG